MNINSPSTRGSLSTSFVVSIGSNIGKIVATQPNRRIDSPFREMGANKVNEVHRFIVYRSTQVANPNLEKIKNYESRVLLARVTGRQDGSLAHAYGSKR
jgi:hypothetical protein